MVFGNVRLCAGLAVDDLGDALVAQVEHLGDLLDRHPAAFGEPDRLVAFALEVGFLALQGIQTLPVLAGEGQEDGPGVWRFSGWSGDAWIVGVILASRLARTLAICRNQYLRRRA
jgi:hypothetical protein